MTVRSAKMAAILLVAVVLLLGHTAPAHAFNEVTHIIDFGGGPLPVRTGCWSCHAPYAAGTPDPWGVHGGYTTTTYKCVQCHSTHHAESASYKLLPGPTIADSCNVCHDGTGGEGVYNVIQQRMGTAPGAQHRVEVTDVVPGGDAATGGSATMAFRGAAGTLTCTDCHSIHGADLVTAFAGDRRRTNAAGAGPSTKILKRHPGGSAATVTEYGSDWCLGCHAGRAAPLPAVHNHPVETAASAGGNPYIYRNTPILAVPQPTAATVLGAMGVTNRGYIMPWPRTGGATGQSGHGPLCQQCHEDSRNVGTLNDNGTGQAALWQMSNPVPGQPDGGNAADNPRFGTFPHESVNPRFLVETEDDLCLNCHPAPALP